MTYVIAEPCLDVKDRSCLAECPVDCIYEGERMLYIHPDECVDCGACEPVCPVEAIYYEDDVPDQWSRYYKINLDFFEGLGSPGGASKIGAILPDKSVPEKRMPPVVSLPELPPVTYHGMVHQFAVAEPELPGTVALIDATTESGVLSNWPDNPHSHRLVYALLLFYDRVLILLDQAEFSNLNNPIGRLYEAGLVEFSAVDPWVVENAGTLLKSCAGLSSDRQVSDSEAWLLAKDRRNSRLFARLWMAAEELHFEAGPRRWDRNIYRLARFLLPQVIQFTARQRGLAIDCATDHLGYLSVVKAQVARRTQTQIGVSDFERVASNILPLTPEAIGAFRAEHGGLFREHMALVRQSLERTSSIRSADSCIDTAETLERLAESAYRLYTATRGLPRADHGSWSMGAVRATLTPWVLPERPSGDPAGQPLTEVFSWILSPPCVPEWKHERAYLNEHW